MAGTHDVFNNFPSDISVIRFASARAQEITALTKMIENPQTTKLIFQKLPCHMRRRAMSHNPNRMPRILREAHKAQMAKSGPSAKHNRPRRKFRRRPSRLLEEYKKRSSKSKWLETHIWHAKRFHMTLKWGYHLPERSCARSHRFCYRSVSQHSLLLDISYLQCIEIQGPENLVIKSLSKMCDPKTGPTIGAKGFLNGNHQGQVTIFKQSSFPNNPIGVVSFIWRSGESPELRTLWIFSHPAFHETLCLELAAILNADGDADKEQSLRESAEVQVTYKTIDINRFRLRGPTSYSVVSALLDAETRDKFSGSQSPGRVIGVEVRDPRILLHQTRHTKPAALLSSCEAVGGSSSKLWDASIRDQITELRKSFPDHVIYQRRSQLLVPGSELPVQPEELPIPLLLINAVNEGSDFIPGCDIILPAGWATSFWLALTYAGGHAGGLKDVQSMNYEHGICRDLCLSVDSEAGKAAAAKRQEVLKEKYFRRPPKTRTNYIKLATPFPFGIDWDSLVRNWTNENCSSFVVLRDRKLLENLSLKKTTLYPDSLLKQPYLLPVTVRLRHGSPVEFSMICLPSVSDKPGSQIIEPNHPDTAAKERKLFRREHNVLLKSLAKKRKQVREKGEEDEDYSSMIAVQAHKEKMRSLWLPPLCNLKTSFARPIIGFVTQGDFSLSEGKGMARGFMVISALAEIRNPVILVRNPGTNVYMWADMTIE